MRHIRLNELVVDLRFDLAGPLLVKEGDQPGATAPVSTTPREQNSRDSEGHANVMHFVRTARAGADEVGIFYLPGAGLKGVLRSASEQRARAYDDSDATHSHCCNPFGASRCGKLAGERANQLREAGLEHEMGSTIYANSCPICRCFGHERLAGRWLISDAMPTPFSNWHNAERLRRAQSGLTLRRRDGVGISRHTGGAEPGVLYSYDNLSSGSFYARLSLINYELWQLGLLAYLLADIESGRTRIGYGTRRGLGRVSAKVEALTWCFLARPPQTQDQRLVLTPLGAYAELADYGVRDGQEAITVAARRLPGRLPTWSLNSEQPDFNNALAQLWAATAPLWSSTIAQWPEVVYG